MAVEAGKLATLPIYCPTIPERAADLALRTEFWYGENQSPKVEVVVAPPLPYQVLSMLNCACGMVNSGTLFTMLRPSVAAVYPVVKTFATSLPSAVELPEVVPTYSMVWIDQFMVARP